MKKTIIFLFFVLLALFSYLAYEHLQSEQSIVTITVPLEVRLQSPTIEKEVKTEGKTIKVESFKECYVLGPISSEVVKQIAPLLRQKGLQRQVVISDHFLPERFIIFLGPLENKTSLRAFLKQLKQQGFKRVRPIERGVMAPGIEIAEFDTESKALTYIESGKAPQISGIRVIKRLGGPSGKVNLIFQSLDENQADELFKLATRHGLKDVQSCHKN